MASFDDEEFKALHENSAQDIFNGLRQLESDRPIHERRWPWELLQNAADTASQEGVDCTFTLSESETESEKKYELRFSHNGIPFTMRNVAHLILHGSTKSGEEKRVRFGTGFIATHLLSRVVNVRGQLDDCRIFGFPLSRDAADWHHMEDLMDEAKGKFRKSLTQPSTAQAKSLTEYAYTLSDQGKQTARVGLDAVEGNAPLILALNKKLHSVKIVKDGKETTWTRGLERTATGGIRIVGIEDSDSSVALVSEGEVTVAALLKSRGGRYEIDDMSRVPKLYYEFPLALTENFPIPVAVVSSSFVPRNERDGLLLGSDNSPSNALNKSLLETGCRLLLVLAEYASRERWGNPHRLAELGAGFAPQWLDLEWMKKTDIQLIRKIENLEVVEIPGDPSMLTDNELKNEAPRAEFRLRYRKPVDCFFPYDANSNTSQEIWNLASILYSERIPAQSVSGKWASILLAWSGHLGVSVDDVPQALTLTKLAQKVSQIGSLKGLLGELKPKPPDAIGWYNDFAKVVTVSQPSLLKSMNLIPDQSSNGTFRGSGIHRDPGIDLVLKEAMRLMGNEIFSTLCDTRVEAVVQNGLQAYEKDSVVRDAIDLMKKKSKSSADYGTQDYENANIALFQWLVVNKRFGDLADNFPLLTHQKELRQNEFLTHLLKDNPMLASIDLWHEPSRRHSGVFPDEKIMAGAYTQQVLTCQRTLEPEEWEALAKQGLVLLSVFDEKEEELDEETIRNLLVPGEKLDSKDSVEGHKAIEKIKLKTIAFAELPNRGFDAARKTKKQTKEFLDFFLSYVASNDNSWLVPVPVKCSCKKNTGTHSVYPSKWLSQLRSHKWVCIGHNLDDYAKAESLLEYFQPTYPEMVKLLSEERPSLLLNLLGIGTVQLMMASQSLTLRANVDSAFAKLLLATNSDADEISKISEVYKNKALRSKLDEAFVIQQRVKSNQKIGKTVEESIRGLLGGLLPENKFGVSEVPQHVGGSDVLVEVDADYEFLSDDLKPMALRVEIEGAALKIEVKSARQNFVRITPKQAEEAIANPDSHVICVVEIPSNFDSIEQSEAKEIVRKNALFLLNAGPQIGAQFQPAVEVETLEQGLKSALPQDVMVELVRESEVRVRLRKSFWTGGVVQTLKIDQFVDYLVRRRSSVLEATAKLDSQP